MSKSRKNSTTNSSDKGGVVSKNKYEAEVADFHKKYSEQNAARATIYSWIFKWTGVECSQETEIPIMRDGKQVGAIATTILSRNEPVDAVVRHAERLNVKAIQDKLRQFEDLKQAIETAVDVLGQISGADTARLNRANALRYGSTSERVVLALGADQAFEISGGILVSSVAREIENISNDLEDLPAGRGRPKNEAAHGVALGLAKLYAKITGEAPTYSEGPNGLTGRYTPALRDVFDALGWTTISLKTPAENAISQITDEDLEHPVNGLIGLLSSAPTR